MTTTITVTTHAHPARFHFAPVSADGSKTWDRHEDVAPQSTRDFYVHSENYICVEELPIGIGHNGGPALSDA